MVRSLGIKDSVLQGLLTMLAQMPDMNQVWIPADL
jgi:hypothetical protein